ncbi:PPP5C [Symbiodinium microadriaticum]|nr:PPP5C [Symbiodinium microadriaticum]
MRLEWGSSPRLGLAALNCMMDRMGGRQVRHWIIKPRFEKKLTIDQQQRAEGYQFIRDFGPKANNCSQFMEWTDEQIHTPGGRIENWPEGKVKEARHNYMRGRQNAKTLEFWQFTLKSFTPSRLGLDQDDPNHEVTFHHLVGTNPYRQIAWIENCSVYAVQVGERRRRPVGLGPFHSVWQAPHNKFMDMIKPYLAAIDEDEDMANATHRNRGNHEFAYMSRAYGFEEEALLKYPRSVFDAFQEVFSELPLATLVNGSVFVTHGGLFRNPGVRLRDIAMLSRTGPCTELAQDLLWSDPINEDGRFPSQRGAGIYFGPDVTEEFCRNNNLLCCIRSHEVKHRGYEWQRGGRCLTVFSAANYVGRMGNLGAVRQRGRCHQRPPSSGTGDLPFRALARPRARLAQPPLKRPCPGPVLATLLRRVPSGTQARPEYDEWQGEKRMSPPSTAMVQVQAGGQKPVVYRSPIPAKPSALSRSSTLPMARTNPQDQKSISTITELLKDRSVLKRAVVQCFKRDTAPNKMVIADGSTVATGIICTFRPVALLCKTSATPLQHCIQPHEQLCMDSSSSSCLKYCRGLNNYQYYFGGFLIIIIV